VVCSVSSASLFPCLPTTLVPGARLLRQSRRAKRSMKRTYDLTYLKHKSRMIGNLAALQQGNSGVRQDDTHWSWKQSEVLGRHKLYRHINVPHSGTASTDYFLPTGSLKHGKEATVKHCNRDESATNRPSFYDRNNLSQSAKRKRASLAQFRTVTVCG